jgi:hypothetical protein
MHEQSNSSWSRADEAAAAFHAQKKDAVDVVGRALFCFNDRYVSALRACSLGSDGAWLALPLFFVARGGQIYSGCQESLRLGPQGALDVPPASTDAFCEGPCLAETERVLRCINGVMGNFRFYNGASVDDVGLALSRGCGHTGLRGDFDVLRGIGGGYGDGYLYGRGSSGRPVSLVGNLLLLSAGAAILLHGWYADGDDHALVPRYIYRNLQQRRVSLSQRGTQRTLSLFGENFRKL